MRKPACLAAVGLVALLAATAPVGAQTVTVGTATPSFGNCIPFGCPALFNLTRYQQVYASSAFSGLGAISINGLTFFNSPGIGFFANAAFTIFFSTTSAPVNGLSSNLGSNVGGNNAQFAAFATTGSAVGGAFNVWGSPFLYDPSGGNLLMDIFVNALSDTFSGVALDSDLSGSVTTRAFVSNGIGTLDPPFAASPGLVTQFSYTITPEPEALPLLGVGLLALGLVWWRRRAS
jgi:hypothetical protein